MGFVQNFMDENKAVLFSSNNFEEKDFAHPKIGVRWLYIVIAWFLISITLGFYGELLVPIVPDQGFYREFIMSAGQVVFQTLVIGHLTKGRLLHYLGNMMTVSLIGAFILVPMLLFAWITQWDMPWFYVGYFLMVVIIIILIHKKRVKQLKLPWIITLSWIGYRVLLLALIYGIGPL